MSKIRIERMKDCPGGEWGFFVAVYKNDEYLGSVITDGTLTPEECYNNLLSNWEIDELERSHYNSIKEDF